ncbi:hypothetical protein [Moraxella oblonga]|uniref:hypothetical protein n=1 Tax=Moraxella oblonga TaxID=200413 RepID=UPI00082DC7DD|nr:hypothetical protein [Moraxella oblonga]
MLTVTSGSLQTKFGEISNIVKSREPVIITEQDKPTMMLMAYDDGMEILRQYHAKKFIAFLDERANNNEYTSDDELADLLAMIDEERNLVYQEKLANNA